MFSSTSKTPAAAVAAVLVALGAMAFYQIQEDKTRGDEQRMAVEHVGDHLVDRLFDAKPAVRKWSDETGKFEVDAALVGASGSNVVLKKAANGVEITTPVGRLCDRDRRYVESACTGERVNLPHDETMWRLTVVFSPGWSQQIAGWFDDDAGLRRLKSQTLFDAYSTGDPLYRDRIRLWTGNVNWSVILQQPNGQIVYKRSDAQTPTSADALRSEIDEALAAYSSAREWGLDSAGHPCPICPHPQPAPAPLPQPTPNVVPDTGPPAQPAAVAAKTEEGNLAAALICGIVGAALGLFHYLKQDVKSLFA